MEDDFEYNHGKLFIERGRLLRYQIFQYALDGTCCLVLLLALYGISFSKSGLLVAVMSLCCVVTLMMVPVVHVVLLGSIIEVECGCRLGSS